MATSATAEAPFAQAQSKDPFWAPASVIGLAGFGTTTMLAGISVASLATSGTNWGVANGAVFPMAMAFGGTAQFVAGIIMLRRGEIFAGSAFVGYGAFWWAFTFLASGLLGGSLGGPGAYGIAWFMVVWAMWTFSFLISSYKHGWGIVGVFLLLEIAYILLAIVFGTIGAGHTPSNGLLSATGIITFLDGAVAWYVATGILTAAHHDGRKVLPF
ncbi:MAG: acetate uptake transporter [Thermoplasmata archaeon]